MNKTRLLIALVLLAAIAAFFIFDLQQYLSLEFFKLKRAQVDAYYAEHPWQTAAFFLVAYIAMTALSIPGATVLTLIGGAVFGLVFGIVLVSFASAIGATLAFLASRLLLRDWVQAKFGDRLASINAGIEREGAFYLFALRLVPLFPFFVVNLLMGLTKIRTWTFYWVSQLGMLAGTIVYVYAGTKLGEFRVSAGLVIAFVLLGILPLAAKKLLDAIKARKVYAKWKSKRPASYDYNLVVIGAGSAGLVSAYIAAATKAKVALIEKHKMGGDCLNTGCVPSKALIRSAKLLSHIARSREFGIDHASAKFDFADVMERVSRVIKQVEPHDSVERYEALGVECIAGTAKITSPWTVEVETVSGRKTLTTKSIAIAAGARPFVPPIPGLDQVGYLTSDTVWNLRELPRRLMVLGGGPIGCELTQAFARLGSQVTQIEMLPRLMVREDPEVSQRVHDRFVAEGIDVKLGHKAVRFEMNNNARRLIAEHEGQAGCNRVRSAACRRRPRGEHQRLRARRAWDQGDAPEDGRDRRHLANALSEHLRVRRCRRTVSVHAHRVASGVVRGRQRAVRYVQEIQGRLPGDSLGNVYRSRSGACRIERTGSSGKENSAYDNRVRHRRSGSRDRRRRSRRLRQSTDCTGH